MSLPFEKKKNYRVRVVSELGGDSGIHHVELPAHEPIIIEAYVIYSISIYSISIW
jgi:hypothetical protein